MKTSNFIQGLVDNFFSNRKVDITEATISELYELSDEMYKLGYNDRGMDE